MARRANFGNAHHDGSGHGPHQTQCAKYAGPLKRDASGSQQRQFPTRIHCFIWATLGWVAGALNFSAAI